MDSDLVCYLAIIDDSTFSDADNFLLNSLSAERTILHKLYLSFESHLVVETSDA